MGGEMCNDFTKKRDINIQYKPFKCYIWADGREKMLLEILKNEVKV